MSLPDDATAPLPITPVSRNPQRKRSLIIGGVAGSVLLLLCLCIGGLAAFGASPAGKSAEATRLAKTATAQALASVSTATVRALALAPTATVQAVVLTPTIIPTTTPGPTATATRPLPLTATATPPAPTIAAALPTTAPSTLTPAPPTATATVPPAVTATAIPPSPTAIPPSQTTIPPTATPAGPVLTLAQLVAVSDGATIKVRLPDNTEASVLMIGVDTPFPSECFGAESAVRTTQLLQGRTVELEADKQDKNAAGQLLRYVWVWGEDGIRRHVNLELAKGGLAAVYNAAPNGRYQADLDTAQKTAQAQKQGLWASCGKAHALIPPTPTPLGRCSSTDAQRLVGAIQTKAGEWDDATHLANSTPRVALAPQIQNLQRIRREAAALTVPSCGARTLALLITYFDTTISAFIDFLGQGSQYTTLFARASTQLEAFNTELRHVTVGP